MLRCIRMVILTAALMAMTESSARACCLFPLLDPTFWFGGCCFNNPAAGRQIIDDWLGYGYLKGQQGSLGHYPLRPWNCYTPAYTRLNAPAYYPPLMARPMVAPLQPMPMPQPMFMPTTPFAGDCGCDPCGDPCGDPCSDPCGDPCSGLAGGGMMMSPGGMYPSMGYPSMGYPGAMATPRFPTAFPSAWPTPQWKQTQYMAPSPVQTADCGCNGSSGGMTAQGMPMNMTAMNGMYMGGTVASTWTPQPQVAWNAQPQVAWRPQAQYAFQPMQPQFGYQPMQPQYGYQPMQPQYAYRPVQPQMVWTPAPQTAYAGDIWGDHEYSSIPGLLLYRRFSQRLSRFSRCRTRLDPFLCTEQRLGS